MEDDSKTIGRSVHILCDSGIGGQAHRRLVDQWKKSSYRVYTTLGNGSCQLMVIVYLMAVIVRFERLFGAYAIWLYFICLKSKIVSVTTTTDTTIKVDNMNYIDIPVQMTFTLFIISFSFMFDKTYENLDCGSSRFTVDRTSFQFNLIYTYSRQKKKLHMATFHIENVHKNWFYVNAVVGTYSSQSRFYHIFNLFPFHFLSSVLEIFLFRTEHMCDCVRTDLWSCWIL